MSNRKTLLVGSIPAASTEEAVELALDELGPDLIAIPDGETGDRKTWVTTIIDRLSNNPAVYLKKAGRWTSYEDLPRYRVRLGKHIAPQSLDLGYHRAYQQSRPVVEAAAAQRNIAAPPFQVGVASAFDLALFSLGFIGALRHRGAFNAAAEREIAAIRAEADDDVVFQIEVPAELVTVVRAPAPLRAMAARWMGRVGIEAVRSASPGTRFGIHLCYGDLGNRSLVTDLDDCAAAVALINSMVSQWPAESVLEYVHLPLAAGNEPPRLSAAYYAPLARLRLPAATRLVAGFVHESLDDQQLRDVLRMIEAASGRCVDIAAACGLGRREQPVARSIMKESRALCEAPSSGHG
jgi:hypothetical protein